MEKYFAFIFLLLPQLLLAQTGDGGAEHGLRVGDKLSREVVVFDGSEAEPVIHYTLMQNAEARLLPMKWAILGACVKCEQHIQKATTQLNFANFLHSP